MAQPALLARLHSGPGDGLVQMRVARGTPLRLGGVSELPTVLEAVVRWDSLGSAGELGAVLWGGRRRNTWWPAEEKLCSLGWDGGVTECLESTMVH